MLTDFCFESLSSNFLFEFVSACTNLEEIITNHLVDSILTLGLKLEREDNGPHIDSNQYRRLVGRILYLQATRLD